jgi:hypothetical protein
MDKDGLTSLETQLRDSPPAAVRELADEHLAHLASALRAARHREAAQLAAASDQALALMPRLLRGPVKKIVG